MTISFSLVTHERERLKSTNTGRLVLDTLGQNASCIEWKRREPDESLIDKINDNASVLIYPDDTSPSQIDLSAFSHFILLDGTWQQARKMFNQSSYLKTLPRFSIPITSTSRYTFRRNQQKDGLCTAESVIEILKLKKLASLAESLDSEFEAFLTGTNHKEQACK